MSELNKTLWDIRDYDPGLYDAMEGLRGLTVKTAHSVLGTMAQEAKSGRDHWQLAFCLSTGLRSKAITARSLAASAQNLQTMFAASIRRGHGSYRYGHSEGTVSGTFVRALADKGITHRDLAIMAPPFKGLGDIKERQSEIAMDLVADLSGKRLTRDEISALMKHICAYPGQHEPVDLLRFAWDAHKELKLPLREVIEYQKHFIEHGHLPTLGAMRDYHDRVGLKAKRRKKR